MSHLPTLTKSNYMDGLSCQRKLYLSKTQKKEKASLAQEHIFNQGYEFQDEAVKLFKNAVDLSDENFQDNLDKTKAESEKPIIEAGFKHDQFYVRADIFDPKNGFLYEVKSSSKAKKEHIEDLAFQKYVIEQEGYKVKRSFVIHANKEYVKHGDINPKEFCEITEVTKKVNKVENIETKAIKALATISQNETPDYKIGKYCKSPHECNFKDDCWSILPKDNIFLLTKRGLDWAQYEQGVTDVKDIEDTLLNEKDTRLVQAHRTNKPYIDKQFINSFIESLVYPLYHFDFETFATAVPVFDQTKPWQKVPFQYSLHVQGSKKKVAHHEFLSENNEDPRLPLLKSLESIIGETGNIVVYNESFERSVLTQLGEDFPQYQPLVDNMLGRIIDLATPFKNFHFYDPSQKGSWSIKYVLPALTDVSYDNLEIKKGDDASAKFFYSHIKEDSPKEQIRKDLLKYCALDTSAMIDILSSLKKL